MGEVHPGGNGGNRAPEIEEGLNLGLDIGGDSPLEL